MTDKQTIAEKLLMSNSIKLSPEAPFTWASGWKSPIYCDNRKVLGYPYIRDFVKSELCNVIFSEYPQAELIAGVATAGIPWGAMAADQLKMPFVYVRPKPKEHGLENQVEGYFIKGQKTIVVEDLISTGQSSIKVAKALQAEGLEIVAMVCIFNYGFELAMKSFSDIGIPVYSLCDYETLISLSLQRKQISQETQQLLLNWRKDPANWKGL